MASILPGRFVCWLAAILVLLTMASANAAMWAPGFVNVRNFGARGDGRTDDTIAINKAIASLPKWNPRQPFAVTPLYFPDGVYLVSDTIRRQDSRGAYAPALAIFGQSRSRTILRLNRSTPGYLDAHAPKAVLYYSSGLLGANPNAGGKDYTNKGEGNDAYQNYLVDISVEVREGNPGAVAVDYIANNIGAIRNVTVKSVGAGGAIGISLKRKWIGPAFLKDVAIENFAVGLDIANREYSIVLDKVAISAASEFGVRNVSNVVSFNDLSVRITGGVGIANLTPSSLLVGRGLSISGDGEGGIINQGYMNLSGVASTPMVMALHLALDRSSAANRGSGVFGPQGKIANVAWKTQPREAPTFPQKFPANDVAVVAAPASDANGFADSTAALAAALNSGRSTVSLANAIYRVTAPLQIPDAVHQIEGNFATIILDFPVSQCPSAGEVVPCMAAFVVGVHRSALNIRRLFIDNHKRTASIAILHSASGELLVEDIVTNGITLLSRTPDGGPLWAENVAGGAFDFSGRAGVWVKQLDTEGGGTRIRNNGTPLWILGVKTEGNLTLINNRNGGTCELVGGLVYMVHATDPLMPYIINADGDITAALAEEAFFSTTAYREWVRSGAGSTRRGFVSSDFPIRHHFGRTIPQLTSYPSEQ